MKTMRFLLITGLTVLITTPLAVVQSQDTEPGHKADPDVKWNVRKQYGEYGNLIKNDSSCVHTWNHFDFPGLGRGHAFEDLDSLFGDFFHFPEGMFEHHPFAFGIFNDFMDSLEQDFYLDSSFFHGPEGFFDRHKEWIESFREEFTFPNDSLNQLHPKWQRLPRQQKKPAMGIEI